MTYKRFYQLLGTVSLAFCLIACGGGGGGGGGGGSTTPGSSGGTGTSSTTYPLTGADSQAMTVTATGSATMSSQTLQVVVTDPQNLALSYSIATTPTRGTASVTNAGLVSYSVSTLTNATSDSLSVSVTNGAYSKTVTVPITITTDPQAINASNQSLHVDASSGSGLLTSTVQLFAKNPSGAAMSYAITTAPTKGTASVSATGLVSYSINRPTTALADSLQVTISSGAKSRVITLSLDIDNAASADPLLDYQWHLTNKDQYFSSTNPSAGEGCDLNLGHTSTRTCGGVTSAATSNNLWAQGIKGNNVNVTVVDSGLEINHEDLSANVVAGGSYNFLNYSTNPTNTTTTGDHGTAVAGLIASAGNNGKGGAGIAPKAKLRAMNFLRSNQTLAEHSMAFGGDTTKGAFQSDVFNYSAGSHTRVLYAASTSTAAVYANTANNLRSGKGAIVVKSAGNAFSLVNDQNGNPYYALCGPLPTYSGISCQNVNNDDDNTIYSTIVVAALNADGTKSSYSSTGSPIWISGFGGERNYNSADITSTTASNYKPALLTTDQAGCTNGYVGSAWFASNALTINSFNRHTGASTLNNTCSYTSGFNGTSAAAPTVAGVVALMLQANPQLTWRDVRHILAQTARKISASQAPVTNSTYFSPTTITLEQGWVSNAAGFNFHNYFGFGLVDAKAAVDAAKTYVLGSLGTFTSKSATSAIGTTAITQSLGTSGLVKTFSISGITTVEQAELQFYPASGYLPYCTQIELVSPQNTKSILLNMDSGHTSVHSGVTLSGTRFLSNAFYGENAAGTWTLRFINKCTTTQNLSSLFGQQLTIRGR